MSQLPVASLILFLRRLEHGPLVIIATRYQSSGVCNAGDRVSDTGTLPASFPGLETSAWSLGCLLCAPSPVIRRDHTLHTPSLVNQYEICHVSRIGWGRGGGDYPPPPQKKSKKTQSCYISITLSRNYTKVTSNSFALT